MSEVVNVKRSLSVDQKKSMFYSMQIDNNLQTLKRL